MTYSSRLAAAFRRIDLRTAVRAALIASCAPLILPASAAEQNLADLSIEELLNETITSVSKREQRLGDAAAAIAVLSNDDLRRSGATTVADALRLVPGLEVGSVNSSHWAISARGFNHLYANKLLVLVDGRAVYTPLLSGVYWDLQQMALEDVDRVEIIRGPGATMWGANAVNGVINIVTRSARDTQGSLVYSGFGNVQSLAGIRFGDQLGEHSYYRAFANYKDNAEFSQGDRGADDGWRAHHGGVRIDHYPRDGRHITWQADFTGTQLDNETSNADNVNTLGRWTEQLSERSALDVQFYYDHTYRNEDIELRHAIDTVDVSMQHTFGLGARHDLIWGLSYRFIETSMEQTNFLAWVNNGDIDLRLFSAFVQDEYQLIPDMLTVTAGAKVEHHVFTGFEWQPSIRAVFKPNAQQTWWSAVSRAVGTPNIVQASDAVEVFYGAPFGLYVPILVGNPDLEAEALWAYELGYRAQASQRVSVDATVFYNDYDELVHFGTVPRLVPGPQFVRVEIPWANALSAHTYGSELAVVVSASDKWRLTGVYSILATDYEGVPANDPNLSDRTEHRHRASLSSAYDFAAAFGLNVQLRYVGPIRPVQGYITADVNLSYRPTEKLELTLAGRNLFRDRQTEQPVIPPMARSEVPRSVYGKITWRF